MAVTEAELAARIDGTNMLGKDGEPTERTTRTAAAAPARTTTKAAEPDEAEELPPEEADDTTDSATEGGEAEDQATSGDTADAGQEMHDLRMQIARLEGMIQGRGGKDADSTDGTGGAAAPTGQSAKVTKAFAAVRAKIDAAKAEWGPMIDAIGLNDLIDDLEKDRTDRATAENRTKQEQQQHIVQQQIAAANDFHRGLNTVAKANPALLKAIGIGQHGTLRPEFDEIRQEILGVAIREAEMAGVELKRGRRKSAMTPTEATTIAIKRVTGIDLAVTSPDAQAKDRARMVQRGAGGGTTSKAGGSKETEEQKESRLAKNLDDFMATRR